MPLRYVNLGEFSLAMPPWVWALKMQDVKMKEDRLSGHETGERDIATMTKETFGIPYEFSSLFLQLYLHFYPRRIRYCPVSLCVCQKSAVLSNQLNISSHKQRHRIAHGLLFPYATDLGEIPMGTPPMKAPNTGGIGQNRIISTSKKLYLRAS